MEKVITVKHLDRLTYQIIGSAIEVHKAVGPGLLESVYEKCLIQELRCMGLTVTSQQKVPLVYKGIFLQCDLRYDLLVEDLIVVEVKAVERIMPIHEAQLITYINLLKKPKGILLNFNCTNIFRHGQKTLVSTYFSSLPPG